METVDSELVFMYCSIIQGALNLKEINFTLFVWFFLEAVLSLNVNGVYYVCVCLNTQIVYTYTKHKKQS
jgi:hypothetical protein